jgi:hypothetical protein
MHNNISRPRQTLTKKAGTRSPLTMAAGIATYLWSLTQLAGPLG